MCCITHTHNTTDTHLDKLPQHNIASQLMKHGAKWKRLSGRQCQLTPQHVLPVVHLCRHSTSTMMTSFFQESRNPLATVGRKVIFAECVSQVGEAGGAGGFRITQSATGGEHRAMCA